MPQSLIKRDQDLIWHPYTQHKNMISPIPIVRGEGTLLFDEEGNAYIDAVSSWWVTIHGHAHPYIAEKIFEQAKKLEQVIFTSFTHEPAVLLAERLLPMLPGDFSKIFYSDDGSTAVEVAIKMALQYWLNKGGRKVAGTAGTRNKILAFHHSYHGDTFGAMSVSSRSLFTDAFRDYLFEVIFIDVPTVSNIDELRNTVNQYGEETACFIYEPLLQAAGGMHIHEAALLDELLATMRSNGIICIADEVLTGFGRTGKLFAGEFINSKADIICLSKGLTGGTMAMGATACSQKIFDAFLSEDRSRTFFHGHSYTANPIACSAALASLELLDKPACVERIRTIVKRNKDFITQLRSPHARLRIRNARQCGTVIAFEIDEGDNAYLNQIGTIVTRQSLAAGIYLRPLGNTIYMMPPYCITDEELDRVYEFLEQLSLHRSTG